MALWLCWIVQQSQSKYKLMAPSAFLSLLDRINDLKRLPRTGWLFAGVPQPESIADHTSAVALLTLVLAAEINSDPTAHRLSRPLDVGRAVQIALVHDLAESLLTDLPKRSTELISDVVKHAAELNALHQMLAGHPAQDEIIRYWQEYSDASTPEGRLVRDVDKLEMIHQALRYEQSGNRNLEEFFRNQRWHYAVSELTYASLYKSRN